MTSPFPALEHPGLQLRGCGQAGLSSPNSSTAGGIPGCVLDLLGAVPVLCPSLFDLPLPHVSFTAEIWILQLLLCQTRRFSKCGGIWGLAGSCSRVCSSTISIPAAPPSSRSVPAPTQALPGTLPRGICSQIRRNKGGNHPTEVCRGLIQCTQSPGQQSSPGAQPDVELESCLNRNCFCIPMRSAAAWARGEGGTCRKSSWCWAGLCCRAPGEDGCGLWLPHSLSECRAGSCSRTGRDGCGEEPSSLVGRCREEPGSWKGHEEALELFAEFLLCLKDSLSSPASCRSILGFIASPFCHQPRFLGCPSSRRGLWQAHRLLPCQQTSLRNGFRRGRFRAELPQGPWPVQ